MRTSKIVTFAALIAVTAMLFGAAVFFPMSTQDAVQSPGATMQAPTATLDPSVVVATK